MAPAAGPGVQHLVNRHRRQSVRGIHRPSPRASTTSVVALQRGHIPGHGYGRQVEESARENALESSAGSLAEAMPSLTGDQTLEQALSLLVERDRAGMPVLSTEGRDVLGWITHRDVLRTYNERLQRSVERTEGRSSTQADTTETARPGDSGEPAPSCRTGTAAPSPASPAVRPPATQRSLARLQGYRIINIELTGEPLIGRLVAEVDWPRSSVLLALRRNGRPLPATAETRLQRRDRLSLLVPADQAREIIDKLGWPPPQHRGRG